MIAPTYDETADAILCRFQEEPLSVRSLRQVAQHVDDLDRAVQFYLDVLGLTLIARFDPPGLAFFDLAGTRLLLDKAAPSSLLYLDVDDIEGAVADLHLADVHIETDPHVIFRDDAGQFGEAGAEEWMAFFRDSENNVVGLVERRPT